MSPLIGKLFRVKTKNTPAKIADLVLGEVSFSEQLRAWVADVPIGERIIEFVLAGNDLAPTAAVLAHARNLVRDFAALQRMIEDFLAKEALEFPDNADEIGLLRVACISLVFSDRPHDGEIGFSGPGDSGVWHCRYIDGKPVSLGLDD